MRTLLKWALRLVGLLTSLVLGAAVLAVASLYILDDEDYRSALVWAAERFLDASLEIRGPFALRIGRDAALSAAAVSLRAYDGSYTLDVGAFQTRVRLDSLLEGIVWVKDLVLDDVRVAIRQSANASGFDFHTMAVPVFVIEEVRLNNVNVDYQQTVPTRTLTIGLQSLVVDDVNNSGPLRIQGEGQVDDRPFRLQGQLDSLARLLDSARPYSVQLDLASDSLTAQVDGVIARPLAGEGLALQVSITDSRLTRTLRLWEASAPELGSASARMQLRGNYDAPRLEQIDARLSRGGELDLNVSGEVGDLVDFRQLELHVEAHSSNPAVTSWLLFDRRNMLKTMTVKGTLRGDDGHYRVEDLRARVRTRSGVEARLEGSADIYESLNPPFSQLTALELGIDAPSTRSVAVLAGPGGDAMPDFGRIKATARLIPTLQGIALDGARIDVGGAGRLRVTATGSAGVLPFPGMDRWSGFNLTLDAQAEKSTYLNQYVGLTLPELGTVRAQARVRGGLSGMSFESLHLTVGDADNPSLRANGSLRTGFKRRSTSLDIGFDIATADLIATAFGRPPTPSARLGRLEGSMRASDLDGSWGLDKFGVISIQTQLFQFKASGRLGDLAGRDHGEVRTVLEVDDPPALGRALGVDLSGISPYRGQGSLKLAKGRLNYSGSNTVGSTTSRTSLTGSLIGAVPRLQGQIDIPVLHLADFGLHAPPAASGAADRQVKAPASNLSPLFSRDPLDFGILHSIDLNLKVRVRAVTGSTLRLQYLAADVDLQDGVLRVSPVKLDFAGGPAVMILVIDARQKPRVRFSVTGDDLSLGPALAEIQNEVPVEGYVNVNADVAASGNSAHELVSTLEGKFGFGLENARVPSKYVEFLAVDVFGWAFNTAMHRESYSDLDCVMMSFDIKNGIATSSVLAADGPSLEAAGTATIDLGGETIDMTLLPKQKGSLFKDLSPVHVKGPLQDPTVTALPVRAAITSLGSMALVPALPMVAIPAILGERLWETLKDHGHKQRGCARLAEKIVKRKEKDKFW